VADYPVAWLPTAPNLLPVDPVTGGQAVYVDWYDQQSTPVVSVPEGTLPLTRLWLPAGAAWATRPWNGPGHIPTSGGAYTFSTGLAPGASGDLYAVVELYGVRSDSSGLWLGAAWAPGPRGHVIEDVEPGLVGVVCRVVVPTLFSTETVNEETAVWAHWTDLFGDFRDLNLHTTDTPTVPDGVWLSDPVLVAGTYDPGSVRPVPTTETFGALVWGSLPELYQRVDKQQSPTYPLLRYLQGAGVGSDDVIAVARSVYEGDLTDPVACPDAYLGWLMACLGVVGGPSPLDQRAAIASRMTAGRPGTAQNLEAYIQTMLTGSRYVVVRPPGSTAWMLRVTVIDSEAVAAGGPAGIRSKLLASGKLPAGHDVTVSTVLIAWDAADARFNPDWDAGDSTIPNWANLDSSGLGG
jgi:hypothetical protein